MATEFSDVDTIFCTAIEIPGAEERTAYIAGACGGDTQLRNQVRKLVSAHFQAGNFMETPPLGPATAIESPLREGPGTMIGPFKLLEQIGEGGFALVFLAEQLQPVRRQVAVKILKPGMDSRQVIARFEAERQALALMDHPNIARVLDAGETASGRPHFVMELARGVPITAYCDQNGLGTRQRLELFATVCAAVQYAHQKGIIHRDIKPSNVLVTLGEGVVKIIDFGIAKAIGPSLTDKTLHTGVNQMIGTPLYMSPEQAQMGAVDVDTRSDVYSLGVLVYELLTGTTPFGEERLRTANYDEIRRIIREEDPAKPSTRLSTMGEAATVVSERRQSDPQRLGRLCRGELDWIVMKALEKDRTRRYETAAAFAADIQHYLKDEPVSACPPSTWYRFGKMARRNKGTLVTAALVSLALVAGTAVSVWQAIRATDAASAERRALLDLGAEQQATRRELDRAQEAEKKATHAEKKATLELFDSLVAQARANRLSRRTGQRFRTLEIVARANSIGRQLQLPDERFRELRNEAIAALALPDLRLAKEWDTPPGSWMYFDPKLERYARTDRQGTVRVWRAGDGAELWRLPGHGPGDFGLNFSPNGEYLAVEDVSRRRVHVWRLCAPAPIRVLNEPAEVVSQFSPDSRQIAIQQPGGAIGLFDLATKTSVQQLPPLPAFSRMAFHPDGSKLASTSVSSVQVHDAASGQLLWQKKQAADWLEWHPDGNSLAVGSGDVICRLDAATGNPLGNMPGNAGGGVGFTFNPTGSVLVSRGWSGIVRLWNPQNCRQIFSLHAHMETVRFSADGRFLAATEHRNRVGIWEIAAGQEYRSLTLNPLRGNRPFTSLAVNADGRFVAAGSSAGGVCLWDLPGGNFLGFLEEGPAYNYAAFAPSPARGDADQNEEALFTRGLNGLFRRSIRVTPATNAVDIGAAERLPVPGNPYVMALSRDGKVLAAAQGDGAVVWHTDQPKPLELKGHHDVRDVAVSPDGQWVLTGRFSLPSGIKVWRARLGELDFVCDLPGHHTWVAFSPDGKRILTSGMGKSGMGNARIIRRYEVGTWAELPFPEPLEGLHPAYSPDGKRIVLETGAGVARLIDAETAKELARLEDPSQDRANQFAFTPDGTKLLAATGDGQCVHVWDLQSIRRQLAEMNLDW